MQSASLPASSAGSVPPALPSTEVIQQYLEDNEALIQTINDAINLGRFDNATLYQAQLQRNLMWLAAIADAPTTGTLPQPPLPSQRGAADDQGSTATGTQVVAAADAQAAMHSIAARQPQKAALKKKP
ncbi:hypothetical protein WJX81_004132 [Elliptochloris bilobata]|uniref:SS18 N-terminal domain-containing protein n=1 Tax=Elliptochloris bilobata TaxID=381761 RepID=A0AAW1SK33_9CHLO